MNDASERGLLVSDFNLENLSAYLTNDPSELSVRCDIAPFGHVAQILLDSTLQCWKPAPDFLIVWTRPEAVLGSFRDLVDGTPVKKETIWSDVDDYSKALTHATTLAKTVFAPTWTFPTIHLGHGLLDLKPRVGVSRLLMEANLRLLQNLDDLPNVVPLNASRWIELVGASAFNERLWYLGKIPFANAVFKTAAREIKAAIRSISGGARKLVILDLDGTLWGDIVGETGWQNIILGGHHPVGEAFVDFQRAVKSLKKQGVLLAIASKNEESLVWEAINQHPEMVLSQSDFAGWRINWNDKAQNIVEIANELNLGLDSIVFIDDNPVERDRVRQALRGVLVPEWPSDARFYMRALCDLDCFQQPSITDEDRRRSQMYIQERKRTDAKARTSSVEEWLRTLQLTVKADLLGPMHLGRASQLLNKTNQMNLSTRRMTDQEFGAWSAEENRRTWVFYVSDKFGESGLVGVLSLQVDGNRARIVDFVLSCRVLGRKVEETMLHWAVKWARSSGLKQINAIYLPTPKNAACYTFFRRSGLSATRVNHFTWDASKQYPLPDVVKFVPPRDQNVQYVAQPSRLAFAG